MTHTKHFASLAFAALLLVSCREGGKPPAEQVPSYQDIIARAQKGPHATPTGRSAITPSLPGVPSFRAEDARAYAESGRIPVGVARNVHATEVKFLTSAEVSQRLDGANTGFPAETPMCYVEMQGDFTFTGPKGSDPHYDRAFEVFDAKSGNLLLAGGLPAKSTPPPR
jgi:hypothetical protein